jgi:hypothetical protein
MRACMMPPLLASSKAPLLSVQLCVVMPPFPAGWTKQLQCEQSCSSRTMPAQSHTLMQCCCQQVDLCCITMMDPIAGLVSCVVQQQLPACVAMLACMMPPLTASTEAPAFAPLSAVVSGVTGSVSCARFQDSNRLKVQPELAGLHSCSSHTLPVQYHTI